MTSYDTAASLVSSVVGSAPLTALGLCYIRRQVLNRLDNIATIFSDESLFSPGLEYNSI